MRIIALRVLRDFWNRHPDAEIPLRSWYAAASRAGWSSPAEVKAAYRNASFIANNRIVFNIRFVSRNCGRVLARVVFQVRDRARFLSRETFGIRRLFSW